MPIRLYLAGQKFNPETIRLMGIALESAMVALQPEPMGWTAKLVTLSPGSSSNKPKPVSATQSVCARPR